MSKLSIGIIVITILWLVNWRPDQVVKGVANFFKKLTLAIKSIFIAPKETTKKK